MVETFSQSKDSLIILGASGAVGIEILKNAVTIPSIDRVIAPTRKPLASDNTQGKLVNTVIADLGSFNGFSEAENVICAVGTTIKKAGSQSAFAAIDRDLVIALATKAKASGVKRFAYISAIDANPKSSVFYNRIKGQTEHELEALGFDQLLILQPSLLIAKRSERRAGEALAQIMLPLIAPLLVGHLRRYKPVSCEIVARAALRLLDLRPKGTRVVRWTYDDFSNDTVASNLL